MNHATRRLANLRVYSPAHQSKRGPTRMHPVAQQLLERHIEYELDTLTDKRIQPFIRTTVQRWFELADVQTLSDIATEKRCIASARRLLTQSQIPESVGEFGVSLFLRCMEQLKDSGVDLQALIGQDRFLELVELVASLHEPRRRLVAAIFNHPLYSDLISSLVYEALVNYVLQDNLISQKVPGVGSMLKLGRKVATRAVPGFDATVERQLKNYIKSYLPSLIKTSEKFVDTAMTDEALLDTLAESWPEIESLSVVAIADGLEPEDVQSFGAWSKSYWDELRRTDWFMDMVEALIGHCFERYGNEPLSVLLDDFGIKRSMVSKELITFAPPLLKQLRKAGLLDELLRLRFTPFYESKSVSAILKAADAGPDSRS